MVLVNVKNCVRFYSTADEIGAETLKQHCSSLISTHWVSFWKIEMNIYVIIYTVMTITHVFGTKWHRQFLYSTSLVSSLNSCCVTVAYAVVQIIRNNLHHYYCICRRILLVKIFPICRRPCFTICSKIKQNIRFIPPYAYAGRTSYFCISSRIIPRYLFYLRRMDATQVSRQINILSCFHS